MKKVLIAFAVVAFAALSLASCKNHEKCDAYSSSTNYHFQKNHN